MEYLGTGWMLFGGRSQESNLPGTAGGPNDDLPRLDCYMEAGRIIASSSPYHIPHHTFFRIVSSCHDPFHRNLQQIHKLHFGATAITENKKRKLITKNSNIRTLKDGLLSGCLTGAFFTCHACGN